MRVNIPLVAEVKFEGEADYHPYLLTDISWGGLYLRMEETRPIGTKLSVMFPAIDGRRCFEIGGKVVTQDKFVEGRTLSGIGIAFEEVDQNTKSIIQKIVDRLLSSQNPCKPD